MTKTAIVTGAAGVLGKAITDKLVKGGFTVYACDISQSQLDKTFAHPADGVIPTILDVSSEDSWVELYAMVRAQYGHIDVLVNNAGINIRKNIEDCPVEDWDKMFAVNVRGVFLGIKHCLGMMRENHGGVIINTSSVCGLVGHLYTNESYTATKGAVTLLTKSVASRFGKYNIRCNSIHPSTVETDFVKVLFQDPQKKQERLGEVPLGHLCSAEDVANAVGFLASDEAKFLNGIQLPIDGGTTCY